MILSTAMTAGLLLMIIISWMRRTLPSVSAFMLLLAAAAVWLVCYSMEVYNGGTPQSVIWAKLKYVGTVLVPVALLIFALRYTASPYVLRLWQVVLMLVIPLTTLVVIAQDSYSGYGYSLGLINAVQMALLPAELMLIYLVYLVYAYVLVLIGCFILLRSAMQMPSYQRPYAFLILIAVMIPIFVNILWEFDVLMFAGLDLTALALALALHIIGWVVLFGSVAEQQAFMPEALLNKLPDGVMVLNRANRVAMVNPSLAALLRKDAAQIINKPVEMFFPAALLEEHAPDSTHRLHESLLLHGRYLEITRAPLRDRYGIIQGQMISVRDNTIRRQTEAALQANERRYRALFENSQDAIFITDLNWMILIANPQAAKLLKLELDRLLGCNAKDYMHPQSFALNEEVRQRLLSGEVLPLYDLTWLSQTGEQVLTEVNLTLVRDPAGTPLNLQMIVRDITQRKVNERLLNERVEQFAMLRQIEAEMSSSLNIEQVVNIGLSAAMHMSGADAGFIALTQGEAVRVVAVQGAFSPEIIGSPLRYNVGIVGRVLMNQEPERVMDVASDPDYYEDLPATRALMALPLLSRERLLGVLNLESSRPECFTHNVVEFLQLIAGRLSVALDNARLYEYVMQQLEETQALNRRLERLQQTQRDMIRIASHDLKNPLAVVLGYLDIFQMDRDNFAPIYQEAIDLMQRSARRMNQIMEDILTLERIEQRAEGSTRTQVNLLALAHQAVREYQSQAAAKDIRLSLEAAAPEKAAVLGDSTELYEAIVNLVSNAIKYTPPGGQVAVRLSQQEKLLQLEVTDTGYGIPEAQQAQLFQPFFRVLREDTRHIEGTGLGLHLVKNIIERHGGELYFHSTEGRGSTFGFRLACI